MKKYFVYDNDKYPIDKTEWLFARVENWMWCGQHSEGKAEQVFK